MKATDITDTTDACMWTGIGLVILVLLVIIIKMCWNRFRGKDELDGFL